MSDKNGQGTQWSKGAVAAQKQHQHHQQQQQQQHQQQQQIQPGHTPIYNAASAAALGLTSPSSLHPGSALYGGTGHLSNHPGDVVSYASARFQAPPLDHHPHHHHTGGSSSASSSTSASHIVTPAPPPLSSTSNVPVPSGFIPPPFPSAPAAATSVLTPNPYAVASLTATQHTSTNHPHSHPPPPAVPQFSGAHATPAPNHAHFGMEQFQHLNAQQQYELSKLMAATFSTSQQTNASAAAMTLTGPTNLSSNPSTSNITHNHPLGHQPPPPPPPLSTISTATTSTAGRHLHSHPPPSAEASTSGAINSQMADQVIGAISAGSSANTKLATTPIHGRLMGLGVNAPDEEKLRRIQQVVESGIGDHAKQQIVQILDRISTLRPVEKLLLYLRLPGEQPETDPLRQPQNPLGTRSEINHTINWVRTHLEQDPQVSIPKQDVYNDYLIYCDRLDIKPLSTADFGKVMKQVFPGIRPRRLGTRGHSRYCYAAMRKTSKLPAPHLPTLATVKATTTTGEKDGSLQTNTTIIDTTEEQEESWNVIKQWAETMLHVKVDNIQDLATHIKTNGPTALASGTHAPYTGAGRGTANATHKKYTQREPKEKRVMTDMGPLKKRRKKKRKGSSSSESSCHQTTTGGEQQHQQQQQQQQQQQHYQPQLSPANSSKSSHHAAFSPATMDEQKVKIKQEIMDSPGYPPSVGSLSTHSDSTNVAQYQAMMAAAATTATTLQLPPQQQIMPMNLAAETRGGISSSVLARAPPSTATAASLTTSAFEHVRPTGVTTPTTGAVKNLTPKIMELSGDNREHSSSPPLSQTMIKQEIGAEDYNTSNIFCKKVRKAQQTKGFWVNSPTSQKTSSSSSTSSTSSTSTTINLPIITTTASTPPPVPASVITAPPTSGANHNNLDATVVYNMGPPTQMAPSTSPNSQSLHNHHHHHPDEVTHILGQPKVFSRNLQAIRAKRIMAAAAAASANCEPPDLSAVKDAADLPENLGLPRERVISICNMDKHELDDYFLPVEEENSEDQETELLQYFQMGDAEEKLNKNSSSDAKRNSNSTVTQMTSAAGAAITTNNTVTAATTTYKTTTPMTSNALTTTRTTTACNAMMMNTISKLNNSNIQNDSNSNNQLQQQQNGKTQSLTLSGYNNNRSISSLKKLPLTTTTTSSTTSSSALPASSLINTVGTASASLVQLTQKHQQQQMQQQQQLQQQQQQQLQQQLHQQQPLTLSKVSIKRKINLNTSSNTSDITAARKNYSFLPISPNINTTPSSINNNLATTPRTTTSSTTSTLNTRNTTNSGFFASPGLTRLLTKQQSLDCDSSSSDPMIGATRRQRSYNSMMTSASAPPSPSVLKQQEQQLFGIPHNLLIDQWSSSSPSTAHTANYNNPSTSSNVSNSLMVDQNSLDLDLFGEAAAAAASTATNSNFGQRQQFNINLNNLHDVAGILGGGDPGQQLNDATQRSQSVPLSQLQRSHSPSFNRTFHCVAGGAGGGGGANNVASAFSACNSLAQTPVPSEFMDSVTMLSENSCSQQSASIKLEEVANVVASDSTAMLDEVDVSEILSSPDFVTKFSSLNQSSSTTKTTCSSVGSSSGYSSGGHFSLTSGSYSMGAGGGGNGTCGTSNATNAMSSSISRSVPSTPLPHQNPQSLFGNGNNFYRKRFVNNCQTLNHGLDNLHTFSDNFGSSGKYGNYGNTNSSLSRSACDISKSMPSTPITTTPSSFRYSPSDFTRDFLINGNTIDDSITSSFSAGVEGNDNHLMGSDVVGIDAPLNAESLLSEEDCLVNGSSRLNRVDRGGSVITPDFVRQAETSSISNCMSSGVMGESSSSVVIGVGSDLLDNL